MWRQYTRAGEDDPGKRVPPGPGSYGRGDSMFRRYSPATWAVGGLLVAGTIGYFVFYDKSRRDRGYRAVPSVPDRDRDVRTK